MATLVNIDTTEGLIQIELEDEKAPNTVANFLQYVDANHYDGTVFHRIIAGFMAQGGGYNTAFEKKPVRDGIENEATNGLRNDRGTVAMARTSDPHSATAQFFINLADNGFLNHRAKTSSGWGYTVFGKVVEGMDAVDRMAAAETGAKGSFRKDAPLQDIQIKSVSRAT